MNNDLYNIRDVYILKQAKTNNRFGNIGPDRDNKPDMGYIRVYGSDFPTLILLVNKALKDGWYPINQGGFSYCPEFNWRMQYMRQITPDDKIITDYSIQNKTCEYPGWTMIEASRDWDKAVFIKYKESKYNSGM